MAGTHANPDFPQVETRPEIEIVADAEAALDPPVNVLVHNDDVTPIDFVILVLAAIFELSWQKARAVTYRAHTGGVAHVTTLSREEAKYRVGRAHETARLAGYPLSFTIEPAQS